MASSFASQAAGKDGFDLMFGVGPRDDRTQVAIGRAGGEILGEIVRAAAGLT